MCNLACKRVDQGYCAVRAGYCKDLTISSPRQSSHKPLYNLASIAVIPVTAFNVLLVIIVLLKGSTKHFLPVQSRHIDLLALRCHCCHKVHGRAVRYQAGPKWIRQDT